MRVPVIGVQNLYKDFKIGQVYIKALQGINFSLYAGEFLVIWGPSGCGKSTLLNMIDRLEDYDSGDIFIGGENLKKLKPSGLVKFRRNSIGMVFQNFDLISSLTILDNVALPLNFSGISKKERQKRAKELLEVVGLKDRINHFPSELSGGEQQRAAIARALVTNPKILLVDEPTGNLDERSGWEVMSLLAELNRKYKRTILLVTHNSAYFALADRILYMKDGKIEKEDQVPSKMRMKIGEMGRFPNLSYFVPSKIKTNMRMRDIISLAYKHFRFVKSRTFLTLSGIVVGISAIVLLVSLGFGLQKITTERLADFEALNTISVSQPQNKTVKIDDGQVQKIKSFDNVELASPMINLIASGKLLETSTSITLTGVEPANIKFEQINIENGRVFSADNAKEAIVSKSVLKAFDIKDENSVINKSIKFDVIQDDFTFKNLEMTVVGISGEKTTPEVFVPISTIAPEGHKVYSSLDVKVRDRKKISETVESIKNLGLEASSASELIDQVDKAFLIIQLVLGTIGAIAFIVASFGILNTMVISLLERTKEIGIMKAIGVSNRDIKRLFIYEACLFGIFGGLGGIATGFLVGQCFNYIIKILMQRSGEVEALIPFVTPYKFAIIILLFSYFVAWTSSIYPAFRASKLSPLEALRHE
ncbi:MAG: ATP-binding cassette domain-containing protein [Candidatus Berkelbacteria bacterium]|nr:ATP-binding cassette domain-containing protein [Candidatus Berkelbacteria bacterium]